MRLQCEQELEDKEMIPLLPTHLLQLIRLAGRIMNVDLAKKLNQDLNETAEQLKNMMDTSHSKGDDEQLPELKKEADPDMFFAVARRLISIIDEHVQKADVLDPVLSFIPSLSSKQ